MPVVIKRIEKLFPENELATEANNILLTTIRIPKNLLYLTDRLPKPRYASVDEANELTAGEKNRLNITDGAEYTTADAKLPSLPAVKIYKSKKLSRPHPAPNKAAEEVEDTPAPANEYEYKPSGKHYRIMRQYRIPPPRKSPPEESKLEVRGEHSGIHFILIYRSGIESHSPNSPGHPTKGSAIENEEDEKDELVTIKKKSKGKSLQTRVPLEGTPSRLNKKQFLENLLKNNHYENDNYLHQLLNKKNPLVKPLNDNLQNIANIYSANNARQIIAMHKK